jgi:serine protease Do
MKLISFKGMAASVLLSAAFVGAAAMNCGASPVPATKTINWSDSSNAEQQTPQHEAAHSYAKSLSNAFRGASEKVLPSVVTIQSFAKGSGSAAALRQENLPEELRNHPFFKDFFENQGVPAPSSSGELKRIGMGSGVIVDPTGVILTNNHVVKDADTLKVKLQDGRQFEATEWKTDPKTDIAVVKIPTTSNLPVANIGNSDQLDVGDWVIAVGAPFGLDETVTAGIISAKSRGLGIADREEFLQTDAAINPGNSGGPLVNLDGEVVGINTAISSTNGGYQGIGFAVPVNLARWVGDELMKNGTVQRAFLGVGIQSIDSTLSNQLGLNTVKGALITEVRPGTPAAKSGLQSGDVILEFNGVPISKPGDLQGQVERASVQDSHKIVIVRDGKQLTLEVRVEAMPTSVSAEEPEPAVEPSQSEINGLGLQLSELNPDVAKQLGLDNTTGLVITGVQPGSPAANAGLEDGMVIRKVGNRTVKSLEDFAAAMDEVNLKDGILLLVRAGQASQFVVIKG